MTSGFGQRLRRQRERRGVSLAAIAASTKISASLLDALERDDVSHWPSGIYRRAFIRAYATAIGLDPEILLPEFLERFPDSAEPVTPGAPRAEAAEEPPLRLQLADAPPLFRSGRVLPGAWRRAQAVLCDAGILAAIAGTAFIVLGQFWMPFAVASAAYYTIGIVLVGNTIGVWLVAPKIPDQADASEGAVLRFPSRTRERPAAEASTAFDSDVVGREWGQTARSARLRG